MPPSWLPEAGECDCRSKCAYVRPDSQVVEFATCASTDRLRAIVTNTRMDTDNSLDHSAYGHLLMEIKKLLEPHGFIPQKIERHQNRVAHSLANIDRTGCSTAFWLHHFPDSVSSFVLADCNTRINPTFLAKKKSHVLSLT